MTSFADIEAVDREWVWQDRIPAGDVTLLAGTGGIGKSFLLADLAARITTGRPMPDGSEPGPVGSVLLASVEDDPGASTIHRLRAAKADLARVHDAGDSLLLPGDLPQLRRQVDEIGDVKLLVIDPLSAVTSVALGSVVTVRTKILKPLQALAKDTGIAIAVIHHLTKSGVIAGSQGLIDGVRCVLMASRDEANDQIEPGRQEDEHCPPGHRGHALLPGRGMAGHQGLMAMGCQRGQRPGSEPDPDGAAQLGPAAVAPRAGHHDQGPVRNRPGAAAQALQARSDRVSRPRALPPGGIKSVTSVHVLVDGPDTQLYSVTNSPY
jgi:AAA domain